MRNVICLFLGFILLCTTSCGDAKKNEEPIELKVMSFNIWVGYGKSKDATAKVFVESGADIIGVQESTSRDNINIARHIADSLGWHSFSVESSPTIVSKYPIVDTTKNRNGVKIKINEQSFVWVLNTHLQYCPYEPYQLYQIPYCGAPEINTVEEAVASARNTRGERVAAIIADINEIRSEGYPIILTGDFNEPSYLDWTEKNMEAGNYKFVVEWPSTHDLATKGQLKDSYREVFPDEVANRGITWTCIALPKDAAEVYDRIDFVLYSGSNISPKKSVLLGEEGPDSDVSFSDYPSDHRAVMTTFEIKNSK